MLLPRSAQHFILYWSLLSPLDTSGLLQMSNLVSAITVPATHPPQRTQHLHAGVLRLKAGDCPNQGWD